MFALAWLPRSCWCCCCCSRRWIRGVDTANIESRISKDVPIPDTCPLCTRPGHTTEHLFSCPANPTTLTPRDIWSKHLECARFLNLATDDDTEWEGRATRRRLLKAIARISKTIYINKISFPIYSLFKKPKLYFFAGSFSPHFNFLPHFNFEIIKFFITKSINRNTRYKIKSYNFNQGWQSKSGIRRFFLKIQAFYGRNPNPGFGFQCFSQYKYLNFKSGIYFM